MTYALSRNRSPVAILLSSSQWDLSLTDNGLCWYPHIPWSAVATMNLLHPTLVNCHPWLLRKWSHTICRGCYWIVQRGQKRRWGQPWFWYPVMEAWEFVTRNLPLLIYHLSGTTGWLHKSTLMWRISGFLNVLPLRPLPRKRTRSNVHWRS